MVTSLQSDRRKRPSVTFHRVENVAESVRRLLLALRLDIRGNGDRHVKIWAVPVHGVVPHSQRAVSLVSREGRVALLFTLAREQLIESGYHTTSAHNE